MFRKMQSGNASIDRIIATNPLSVNGAAPTVSAPTVIESLPAGSTVKYVIPSFSNTTQHQRSVVDL